MYPLSQPRHRARRHRQPIAFQKCDGTQGREQRFLNPNRNAGSVAVSRIGVKGERAKKKRRLAPLVIPFRMVRSAERHIEEETQELLAWAETDRKECFPLMPVPEIMRRPAYDIQALPRLEHPGSPIEDDREFATDDRELLVGSRVHMLHSSASQHPAWLEIHIELDDLSVLRQMGEDEGLAIEGIADSFTLRHRQHRHRMETGRLTRSPRRHERGGWAGSCNPALWPSSN